jgi:3-deoxy-manno-octulosonate cytidylyltransferase (CMP-KDO synthetase)
MIQWVYEAAVKSAVGEKIVIASPDREILQVAESFGATAIATREDHPSGTDRIAEVAMNLEADFFVNVQGDEPLIDPETIRSCAGPLADSPEIQMASVYAPCPDDEVENPSVVKVVLDLEGNALYFSRHAIPYPRNTRSAPVRKHIGIYAYRRDLILQFAGWEGTPLEQTESLEQLRFLEHGVQIRMSPGMGSDVAVDTPEQAEQARIILQGR